jgi:uncharacterized protein YjbI with pentapeptide repeats
MADGDETRRGDQTPAEKSEFDQNFFLDLAAKGRDAWNAWRRDPANQEVRVTIAGVDFSEPSRQRIDFSGFELGDGADFSGCNWNGAYSMAFARDRAPFTGAIFGHGANFTGAAFGNLADFQGATFGDSAHFIGAAFGHTANFQGATFGDYAHFVCAAFGNFADFKGATFGDSANFTGATFPDGNFKGATLHAHGDL